MHYGDTVIIQHVHSALSIACDLSVDSNPPNAQYLIVGSNENRPTARNTFRILRPPPSLSHDIDDYDDTIKYGYPFVLACNESLLVSDDGFFMNPDLYLSSLQRNYRTATRITNKQSVFLTTQCDAESIWVAALPSQGKSINWGNKYHGDPVLSGDNFLLKHRNTNTCLTVNTTERYPTEYGCEYEVITSPETSIGKLSLVTYEFSGKGTSQTLRKPDLPSHEITFVTSSNPQCAIDHRKFPVVKSPKDLLIELSASIRSLGLLAFVEIRKECLLIDRGGRHTSQKILGARGPRGCIALLDFKSILRKKGVLSDGYYDELFQMFLESSTPSGHGHQSELNYRLLLERLRGKLSSKRVKMISNLYNLLTNDHHSTLTVREFIHQFHYHFILDILDNDDNNNKNKISIEQYRQEYLEDVIDIQSEGRVAVISKEGFMNYWNDFSAYFDNDEEFHDFIHQCCGHGL